MLSFRAQFLGENFFQQDREKNRENGMERARKMNMSPEPLWHMETQ